MVKGSRGENKSKLERKIVEKNRRMHMKGLFLKLSSLIPRETSKTALKETLTQEDHLEQAEAYIKQLHQRVENLREKKKKILSYPNTSGVGEETTDSKPPLPIIDIKEVGSTLEIVVVSGSNKKSVFHEMVSVVEKEGAEVVNSSFSIANDKIFYTIFSEVTIPRIGLDLSTLSKKLEKLVE